MIKNLLTNFRKVAFLSIFLTLYTNSPLTAGCCAFHDDQAAYTSSHSVAEWTVISKKSFLDDDNTIKTIFKLKLVESFKGNNPNTRSITSAGGTVKGRYAYQSDSLQLKPGQSYVLMMDEDIHKKWQTRTFHSYGTSKNRDKVSKFFRGKARGNRPEMTTTNKSPAISLNSGSVPGSNVTATGYIELNNTPVRHIMNDSGAPIPYIIDIDPAKLPTGISESDAIAAVDEAFDAWASNSNLSFRFAGLESFGQAANTVDSSDGAIRLQLHDNYDAITVANRLAIGGGSVSLTPFSGGSIDGQEFLHQMRAFVILESSDSFLGNLNNFKLVITHEIGHALGLTHSSENPNEPDDILADATMYFSANSGSNGATVNAYDIDRIQFGYPINNTPASGIDRIMRAITTSNYSNLPDKLGVNKIKLQAISASGATLTPTITSSSNNSGTFSLNGDILSYTPSNNFSDSNLSDEQIAAGFSFDSASINYTEGTNTSNTITVRVISLQNDTTPGDGLPNTWMNTHFQSTAVGAVGTISHPDSDPDQDRLTNLMEYNLGTDPNLASSGLTQPVFDSETRQLTFTPIPFAPYWIESSSTLTSGDWQMRRLITNPTAGTQSSVYFSDSDTPPLEFYRIGTGF